MTNFSLQLLKPEDIHAIELRGEIVSFDDDRHDRVDMNGVWYPGFPDEFVFNTGNGSGRRYVKVGEPRGLADNILVQKYEIVEGYDGSTR